MENILKVVRIKGQQLLNVTVISLFSMIILSGCGGGGPSDEGENGVTNSSLQADSSSDTGSNGFLNSSNIIKSSLSNGLCQQQNLLLCENFEWSSSLAYRATTLDWSLKGWVFSGNDSSGNFCNDAGNNNSQCALKWMQLIDNSQDSLQTATNVFAAYGAGHENVLVSWAQKWSSNWKWDKTGSSILELVSIDDAGALSTLVSVQVDETSALQLVIPENKFCGREKLLIKANQSNVNLSNTAGLWNTFGVSFTKVGSENTNLIQLSLNGSTIVKIDTADLACASSYSTVNGLTLVAKHSSSSLKTAQGMFVDNVVVTYL